MAQIWSEIELGDALGTVTKLQLEYLALRALPFLLYGALARGLATSRRSAFALTLVGIALVCAFWPAYLPRLLSDLLALAYYLGAAVLVYWLEHACAAGLLRRDAAFALCLALFIFAPASFFGLFAALPMLSFGWCAALSAYSYCCDARRTQGPPRLSACLFFLLVDPTLAYPERARMHARVLAAGSRVAVGFLRMVAGTLLLGLLIPLARTSAQDGSQLARYAVTMLTTLPAFGALYWLRAGFADVQVGLTRALGHAVGECFDRPYLASSPSDFWRRWNTYVGQWARRYVFAPLSLWSARKWRRAGGRAAQIGLDKAFAVLTTFAVLGLLHDALNYAGEASTRLVFLRTFVFAALVLLLWEALAPVIAARTGARETPRWGRALSRLALAHYVVALVVFSGALG